jgi:hypothetical protein
LRRVVRTFPEQKRHTQDKKEGPGTSGAFFLHQRVNQAGEASASRCFFSSLKSIIS